MVSNFLATWADAIPDWAAFLFLIFLVSIPATFVYLLIRSSKKNDEGE